MDDDLCNNLSIRQMKFEEVEQAARLFSQADLHEALGTVQSYYEYDPQSFWVAIDQDQGQNRIIGSCAAPKTTHGSCFLGLYVVDPAYRNLGIGVRLFRKCLEKVGQDGNCGLCAVPSKLKIYKERAGFHIEEGRSMVILEGHHRGIEKLKCAQDLDPSKYRLVKLTSVTSDPGLVQKMIDFDRTVHLDDRSRLLRIFFGKPEILTMAVMYGSQTEDQCVGYGCIQLDIIGRNMPGPLYAINGTIGEILLSELIQSERRFSTNDQLVVYTMDNCPDAIRWGKDVLGLKETGRCERLYTKFVPKFNYDRFFVCHSPDFSC